MSPEAAGKPGPSQVWWGEGGGGPGYHTVPLERKRALGGRRGRKLTESKVHILREGVGRAEKERAEVTGGEGEKQGQRESKRQEEGGDGRTMRRPETQGTQGDTQLLGP